MDSASAIKSVPEWDASYMVAATSGTCSFRRSVNSVTSRLGLQGCNVRPGAGFKDAHDILFQQVDRHCQKDDIFH